MNELALFAGAGGGILGGHLLGWRTVCAVEWEPYPAAVLAQRQNDGILAPFPIWDDVRTFDGRPWRGIVDVVSGGFPCQDISSAGGGLGISDGARSGLWREFSRIICEVVPRFVLVENSPLVTSRGLGTILRDLAQAGYDARWGVFSAADSGAPHLRERLWIVAHYRGYRWNKFSEWQYSDNRNLGDYQPTFSFSDWESISAKFQREATEETVQDGSIPIICRVDDELATTVDQLKAIGNGQVPTTLVKAWISLSSPFIGDNS